jgi:hypothetical protein
VAFAGKDLHREDEKEAATWERCFWHDRLQLKKVELQEIWEETKEIQRRQGIINKSEKNRKFEDEGEREE